MWLLYNLITCKNPKKWKSSELGMSTLENFMRWHDLKQIFFTKCEFHFVILLMKSTAVSKVTKNCENTEHTDGQEMALNGSKIAIYESVSFRIRI